MMHAGLLDRRINIVRNLPTGERTGAGEIITAPSTVSSLWAAKRGILASEFFEGVQRHGEERALFTIRWREDLRPTDTLIESGRTWDIQGIRELGRRLWLEIAAVTVS